MRVLAIGNRFPPAATGGYERIWVSTMAELERRGHDVRILTTRGGAETEPPVYRELEWYWRDYEFLEVSPRERLRLERGNAQVMRRHLEWKPDVVSYWGLGGMTLTLIEHVRRAGIPAVGVVGDAWMVYGREVDLWTRAWRRRPTLAPLAERLLGVPTRVDLDAVRWLFISEMVRGVASREVGELRRTEIVRPGVEGERFRERPAGEWRGRLAVIGRVEVTKGVATAVRAMQALPEASLTVDGPGEPSYLAELKALANGADVRFQVSPADQVAHAYAAADAVLFPVEWEEPWGLVPLEAMSVGRPVIATGTGGSGEYLEHEVNCLLFTPGDAASLAGSVRRLAADPELREMLIAGGRATSARFPQSAFHAGVIGALEEEAAGRTARPSQSRP